jgi:pimeloyl-ACP methyl ester carboxylesterase
MTHRSAPWFVGLTALALASCATTSPRPPTAEPRVVSESYLIPSDTPGIQLFVRSKHAEGKTTFSADTTVLYVHGATSAAEATFDLALDGASWMDLLARHGYDVYLVDVRGYGGSTRPPEMSEPPERNPPVATTEVAIRDVAAAVDHILGRRGVPRLTLLAWSWGCSIAGGYAAQHGDKVNRLVLYAPQWVGAIPKAPSADPMGAWLAWTPAVGRQRIQAGAPPDRLDELLPPASYSAWSAAVLATDPAGARQDPPVVRTPSGVFFDSARYWNAGKPAWDPAAIRVPTLVVHGEWDGVLPSAMAQEVFRQLIQVPSKRLVEIGGATHFMQLEKNRAQLFREVQLFLDEPLPR